MMEPTKEVHYVRDEPRTRAMDGKTLEIKEPDGSSRGVFLMSVKDSPKPGFVFVSITPHDTAALAWAQMVEVCEEIKNL